MLLLGAVVALAVFLLVYVVMTTGGGGGGAQTPTPTPTPIQVVVAVGEGLQPGRVITDEQLDYANVDGSTVPTTSIRSKLDVVGMVVTEEYPPGQPILSTSLREPGVAQQLERGSKAFSMALQEINTFNQGINDGDTIDILWSRAYQISGYVQPPTGGEPEKVEREFFTTKTLLQNIQVLQVVSLKVGAEQTRGSGGVVNASGGGTGDSASEQQRQQAAIQQAYEEEAPPTMVLILSVTDQQAEVIKFARENGKIDIALRATDDTDRETTTGITDRILVDEYRVVLPELLVR
jgi:Flp pilus assembly protein CpaB